MASAESDEIMRSLDSIGREHEELMETLEKAGPAMDGVKKEFADLYKSFNSSAESAQTTERKIDELSSELAFLREQDGQTTRALEEAESTKKSVQGSIDDGLVKVEALREHEKRNRKVVNDLYARIEELRTTLSAGSGWSEDQERTKREHEAEHDNVLRNLDSKNNLLTGLRSDMEKLTALVEEGEQEQADMAARTAELLAQAAAKRDEAQHEQARKGDLEVRLQSLQTDVSQLKATLAEREARMKAEEDSIINTENQLRESKAQMETYLKEYDSLFRMTQKLTEELESQMCVVVVVVVVVVLPLLLPLVVVLLLLLLVIVVIVARGRQTHGRRSLARAIRSRVGVRRTSTRGAGRQCVLRARIGWEVGRGARATHAAGVTVAVAVAVGSWSRSRAPRAGTRVSVRGPRRRPTARRWIARRRPTRYRRRRSGAGHVATPRARLCVS